MNIEAIDRQVGSIMAIAGWPFSPGVVSGEQLSPNTIGNKPIQPTLEMH